MDYLGALRMFVRAVEVGSFSKAAIATNTKIDRRASDRQP